MKNRFIFISSIVISVFLCASYTILKTAGSHPGSTGAPGDATCASSGCHSDAQVIQNSVGVNTLEYSETDSTFIPGQTYTLTVKVNSPLTEKFGFELSALNNLNNTNAGFFNVLESVRTQTISHTYNNDLRYSVTHEALGTDSLSSGYTEWKMKWTAPTINQGPITFYYATNCTNNDGLESGDKIYLSSFVVKPVNTTAIDEQQLDKKLRVFFNRDTRSIVMNYTLDYPSHIKISVNDCLGALVYESATSVKSTEQHEKIILSPNYAKGAYVVRLSRNSQIITKKIIVD
jgi:hypothetical protein